MTNKPESMNKEYGFCIRMNDLPPDLITIAKVIGLDSTLRLCSLMGGEQIYIHRLKSILAVARDRSIVTEFNGNNHLELARRYNIGSKRIRQILKAAKTGKEKKA